MGTSTMALTDEGVPDLIILVDLMASLSVSKASSLVERVQFLSKGS